MNRWVRRISAATALAAVAAVPAAASTGAQRLTTAPGQDDRAVYSPDGSRIAFVSERDGVSTIYVMNADGSGQAAVAPTGRPQSNLAWSPDGSRLAFQQSDPDPETCCGNDEIYVVDADGAGLTNVSDATGDDWEPAWSPDGGSLAFASARSGDLDIHVHDLHAATTVNVTATPDAQEQDPAWSPDGARIAFTRSDSSSGDDVYVVDADGSNLVRVTDNAGSDGEPVWAPDGSKLAFVSSVGGDVEIVVANADGTAPVNVSNRPLDDRTPAWSPDSQRLAFNAFDESGSQTDVHVVDADGTGRTNVGVAGDDFLGDGGRSAGSYWSSDGSRLLVTSNTAQEDDYDVYSLAAGSGSAYAFEGPYAPVNPLPTLNSMSAGRAVPVKFSLGGDFGLDVFAPGSPTSVRVACDTGAPIEGVEETLTAGASSLTYDAATDRYQYVWKTSKEWAGTCRQLVLAFDDGTVERATFLLR